MRILLMGHKGSIGKRYGAILSHFGVDWVGYDTAIHDIEPDFAYFDKVIIATPTETHCEIACKVPYNIPLLCEKPLAKELVDAEKMRDLRIGSDSFVVCNYRYALRGFKEPLKISYNHYHTGRDGTFWDVCQILYLDPDAEIDTQSPFLSLWVNGEEVPYQAIERSYAQMIWDFVSGKYNNLWTFEDGVEMTKIVMGRVERENSNRYSGKDRFDETTEKNIPIDRLQKRA